MVQFRVNCKIVSMQDWLSATLLKFTNELCGSISNSVCAVFPRNSSSNWKWGLRTEIYSAVSRHNVKSTLLLYKILKHISNLYALIIQIKILISVQKWNCMNVTKTWEWDSDERKNMKRYCHSRELSIMTRVDFRSRTSHFFII